ncbi:MAG: DNA methyltransferase [Myxococcota bacterium]
MNQLIASDAATACGLLRTGTQFDLVYLDPPYSVGSAMTARHQKGQSRGRQRPESGPVAYIDSGDVEALLDMLTKSLVAIAERMSPDGALYLHMDWRAVHEAKVVADRVFGRRCYCGDITWTPGNGSRGARGFSVTHQTILVYAKGGRRKLRFRSDHPLLRESYAETSLRMHFRHTDEDGRRYRERTVGGKTYRYYADEGRRLGSVWTDISAMVANTPLMKESTGYPTQKPERLLERIIRASSEPGACVADLMCGSGTTLAVAARLDRQFVGADRSPKAIEIARARLGAAGVDYAFVTPAQATGTE